MLSDYPRHMLNKNELFHVKSKYGVINYFINDYWFTRNGSDKIFEEDLILKYLKKTVKGSRLVLDIGAHAGSHTIVYKALNPDIMVLAFEPQERMFELLKYNIESQSLTNVTLFNFAIGHMAGSTTLDTKIHDPGEEISLSYDPNVISNLGGVGFGPGGEIVSIITIDSLNLERLDYIKIDVQGAENLVILGGRDTITRFKPVIFFESDHSALSTNTLMSLGIEHSLPDTMAILREIGYSQFLQLDNNNYLASFYRDFRASTILLRALAFKRKLDLRRRVRVFFGY